MGISQGKNTNGNLIKWIWKFLIWITLAMELPMELKIEKFSGSKIVIFMGMFMEIVNDKMERIKWWMKEIIN